MYKAALTANLQQNLSHAPAETRHYSWEHNKKKAPEFKLGLFRNWKYRWIVTGQDNSAATLNKNNRYV